MSQNDKVNDDNIKKPVKKQLIDVDSEDDKVVKNVDIELKNDFDVKKTSGRPNKNKVYVQNRQDVLNKISKILGFDGISGIIVLDDVTKEQQENILKQLDDIKLYFNYASWSYFKKDDTEKTYLVLIKTLFKNMGYDVRQFTSVKKEGNVTKKISKLSIIKNKNENIEK